uniref:Lipocalin n=1 Tax=Rhipicephalus zambeziensis TaxID=60191 RepID=A0A224YBT7_9ACAR
MISSSVRLFLLATAGIILTTQSKGGLAWLRASQPEPKCIEQGESNLPLGLQKMNRYTCYVAVKAGIRKGRTVEQEDCGISKWHIEGRNMIVQASRKGLTADSDDLLL